MCGIAGWIARPPRAPDAGVLASMLRAMAHRGPDDQGSRHFSCAATGHEIKTLQAPWGGAVDSQGVRVVPSSSPSGFGPLAFSPDGKWIAAANHTFETRKQITCMSRHSAITTYYTQVKIWDVTTGRLLSTLGDRTP